MIWMKLRITMRAQIERTRHGDSLSLSRLNLIILLLLNDAS